MIIGVTGFFCSGKDTMAAILQRKGFSHISLSDMIREELRRRGLEVTIPNLTVTGNELRRDLGPGILARRALETMDFARNWVVTSIRNAAEVETLRTRPDFVMVFVDATQRTRFERSLVRARAGDPQTFEAFVAEEARQTQAVGGDPAAQALAECRTLADVRLPNDGTYEEFEKTVIEFTSKALFDYFLPRPDWDEYFMMMAEVAATRGNCIKRRVGAVIVKDKQILSTGYNGTPKGIKNCYEGGCPRGASLADSGTALGECLAVHAEENAILQAASHGVPIRGGTLYATLCPCVYCAKSIINAGIVEVVYRESYAMDEVTRRLFEEAGVKCRNIVQPKISFSPKFAHGNLKTPTHPAGERD
jgi:dCMP deaminase